MTSIRPGKYPFICCYQDIQTNTPRPSSQRAPPRARNVIVERWVDGEITTPNGTTMKINAIPDTGASECFISASLAGSLGLSVDDNPEHIRLASGSYITTPGTVDVSWKFDLADQSGRWIKARVLPYSRYDFILGRPFLEDTQTLVYHKERIQTTIVESSKTTVRLNSLHGLRKQYFWGRLNGEKVRALPDSGSEIMVMSLDYAEKYYTIHVSSKTGHSSSSTATEIARSLHRRSPRDREMSMEPNFIIDKDDYNTSVVFADGSTAVTVGVVRGVTWKFRDGTSQTCDFYVLRGLLDLVVLSADFIFGFDIYNRHHRNL